jgi:Flp pilus assembly pilin Flp
MPVMKRGAMGDYQMNEKGQGLVEYAFVILLVALAVILMMTVFGATVGNMFSAIVGSF